MAQSLTGMNILTSPDALPSTPRNPMPVCGKPAASTALPYPVNTSQNVSRISAAAFLLDETRKLFTSLLNCAVLPAWKTLSLRNPYVLCHAERWARLRETSDRTLLVMFRKTEPGTT